jgi:hypothetical protein
MHIAEKLMLMCASARGEKITILFSVLHVT